MDFVNRKYKLSLDDVGSYLFLYWVPTRYDGKTGDPVMAITDDPVMAAFPSVSDVHLEQKNSDVYCGLGIYYGGYEGSSLYRWYRESSDGTRIHIDDADSVTYEVTDADYSFRLLFGYTPVRSDGITGEEKLSEPSDVILPGKSLNLLDVALCDPHHAYSSIPQHNFSGPGPSHIFAVLCNHMYSLSISFQNHSKLRHLFSREIRLREKH
jgi:hypothetical protein